MTVLPPPASPRQRGQPGPLWSEFADVRDIHISGRRVSSQSNDHRLGPDQLYPELSQTKKKISDLAAPAKFTRSLWNCSMTVKYYQSMALNGNKKPEAPEPGFICSYGEL